LIEMPTRTRPVWAVGIRKDSGCPLPLMGFVPPDE